MPLKVAASSPTSSRVRTGTEASRLPPATATAPSASSRKGPVMRRATSGAEEQRQHEAADGERRRRPADAGERLGELVVGDGDLDARDGFAVGAGELDRAMRPALAAAPAARAARSVPSAA